MRYSRGRIIFVLLALCCCWRITPCFSYTLERFNALLTPPKDASLNFVFVPRNYSDTASFDRDISLLSQQLIETLPFSEFKGAIAFWKVIFSGPEQDSLLKQTDTYPYLAVRSDLLQHIFDEVGGNFKLIIIDTADSLSSAELSSVESMSLVIVGRSQYRQVKYFGRGFLHELGHAFGLRDERPGHCPDCLAGPPNCADSKAQAQQWWGDLVEPGGRVGYIQGCCGSHDNIRPTIASLMNDPDKASDFGPVNERYLRKALRDFLRGAKD